MSFNQTTKKQSEKYAEELNNDVTDYINLIKEEVQSFIVSKQDVTKEEIEDFLAVLLNGS
jgi:hypothetical protein